MSKSSTARKKTLATIHPGKILLDDLKDEEISIDFLARATRVPANRISLIVNGRRSISADTAMRLARFFGTTPQYWMNLQNQYDLACVDKAAIERDVSPRECHGAGSRLHPLCPAQRIRLGLHILFLKPLPIVRHINQFAADVIRAL
jgi:antitoxin HigA-1